ncbi:AMP-binding protein [Pseudomaricurvus alkylphenolicus]|jgi:3-hydroxymyristoyl/3-hydroxydecanoyl-(acyl carrier protein) dehydratase|uniref:ApeI family dehydratase n=1 Tax=Pseudomaricurvus alkylphenolicus TaxID=1306991 RepID=UPI00141DDE56|nr:AMP-binding protein [Pseudomaricurvus alkylphenolicus]NIB44227.1 AMP-binding protein [Pseudomaricurvus alkylphenolicus]
MKSPDYFPLGELLTRPPAQFAQCLRSGALQSHHDWLLRVEQWRQLLTQHRHQIWALHHSDTGEFAAILLALWSLGKEVYLPGNAQPQTLQALTGMVDGFIGDFDHRQTGIQPLSPPGSGAAELPDQSLLPLATNRDHCALRIFTSGSSGDPVAITKSLPQLESELNHLHQLWGQATNGTPLVIATVSHQHIYGLLFRVLLPLCAGWCFDANTCEFLEQLQERQWTQGPRILISSPSHLSRIPPQLPAASSSNLTAIFSSGAPLSRDASLDALQKFGCGVNEVYGSSETGGIAWRQQQIDSEPQWQPLPGVNLQRDTDSGCLQVRSQHLPDPRQWYTTADRAQLDSEGRFRLQGRVDRIAKVEGKRLSLDEMERQLLRCPEIEAVRLLVLERQRVEIAAVAVLSTQGKAVLQQQGKAGLNRHLRQQLLSHFELPLLPRRWRYPEQLPYNSQGKLVQQTLMEMFMPGTGPELPQQIRRQQNGHQLELQLRVPADLKFFDGHFDKAPILPGVVQLHWAQHFAQQAFDPKGEFAGMDALKFQQIVVPEQDLILQLTYDQDKDKIFFTYTSERGQHASGRILLKRQAG